MRTIPVSEPYLDEVETRFVAEAMSRREVSGLVGEFIGRFESGFAEFCGSRFGVATSSGTTALQLAVAALGLGPDDEVLVSTLTNMATVFAILHNGAIPIPIDIEPETYNLDPSLLESRITPRTKAIVLVHLFGHPVDMDPVLEVAERYGLAVVEDCAEAHGAEYKGRRVGSLGRIGCFSFYGNKIITTGEGGMCTTQDQNLADKMRSLRSLSFGKRVKFMHEAVGYNYRMTNVQAAIGCGQLEKISDVILRKRNIARMYGDRLAGISCLRLPVEKRYARCVYWMYHVCLEGPAAGQREKIMASLAGRGIETREGFVPANLQTIFQGQGWTERDDCPRANEVAYETFYLPTGPSLTEADVDRVADAVSDTLRSVK
jgi:perosamine synthetase